MGATVLHTSTRDDGQPGWRPLPELLAASDIVSLHLPLTEQTPTALLGRSRAGPDEAGCGAGQHVTRRRSSTKTRWSTRCAAARLAAAGLDVFAVEPVPPDNPLLGLDNVVLTPHVTWYTVDTMRRYLDEAVANCRRLRDGQRAGQCGQPGTHRFLACDRCNRPKAPQGRRPMPIAINS